MNSLRTFELKLFGGAAIIAAPPGIAISGRVDQRHRLALLALLALAPGRRLSREKLIAWLWPETRTERGRSLLNVSVYVLRTALGHDALLTRGDDLCLNSDVVRVDVVEFEAAVQRGDPGDAVALCTGPFLDGFFLNGAPGFERWVEEHRERLRRTWAKAVEELAERAAARGDDAAVAEWWRRLAADDPCNSRIALQLMSALAAAGDRAAAIRHAQVHCAMLRDEIGAEPDAAVTAFAEQLRLGSVPVNERSSESMPALRDPSPSPVPPPMPAAAPESRGPRSRGSLVVAVVAVIALAGLAAQPWLSPASADRASIAVLPFANMGGDPTDEYFTDGMTEELIHALAAVDGLRVTARTSVFQFKGQRIDVRDVGRRLGVASLLEGSVRRSGTRLKVTVQLVRTRDGIRLWSDAYEREAEDALVLQEEIARSIVGQLRPRLARTSPMVARHSADHKAYELYLMGRHALSQRTPATARQAIAYFEQAIARDPRYALAHSGLADAYTRLYDIAGLAPGELVPRIRAAAQRALELDSTLAEPYALLGWIHTHDWEWPEAEAAFERAIELDPERPETYLDYSTYLDDRGRFDEALEACLLARQLDPLSPRAAYNVAGSYLHLARFEPAIEEARAMIALNPTLPLGYDALGWALVDSGRPAEAIEPLERAVALGQGRWLALANLGRAYAGVGRNDDALAVLARLDHDWGGTGFGHFAMAAIHLALGERERALQNIEQVYRLRHAKLPHLRQWSAFEPLYGDPDFLRIVHAAGF